MTTMHDNGCTPQRPDLGELIDRAGAVVAAVEALKAVVSVAADAEADFDRVADATMLSVASDANEAGWYLRRALQDLRGLL